MFFSLGRVAVRSQPIVLSSQGRRAFEYSEGSSDYPSANKEEPDHTYKSGESVKSGLPGLFSSVTLSTGVQEDEEKKDKKKCLWAFELLVSP